MKTFKRKVNYVCRKYTTSIPLEVAKLLQIEKGDDLEYLINEDGTVTIKKAKKENENE